MDVTPAVRRKVALITPRLIRPRARQNLTPKRKAISAPVADPLPGIGRATKSIRKSAP